MNKLISIVGNTGAGKTTLVRALYKQAEFALGLEQHAERPFQLLFKHDPQYAFANQVDYLLQRAKQEFELRQSDKDALVDGGLDLDFFGFTRLFHARGFLSDAEYSLCKDLYTFYRSILPLPDLIIHLIIDQNVLLQRLEKRDRINIATSEDLGLFDSFLIDWVSKLDFARVVHIEATSEDQGFSKSIPFLLERIRFVKAT
jgi:deoxyadenosine/deoxycytidine kinase